MIQYWKKYQTKTISIIKHREGTSAFRLRKDLKKAEKDELITILKTVDRAIKRSTSKSKLSQLKQIKKQLVKNTKVWKKNLSNMNELKKLFRRLQADTKSVLFIEENINDKLLKKVKIKI